MLTWLRGHGGRRWPGKGPLGMSRLSSLGSAARTSLPTGNSAASATPPVPPSRMPEEGAKSPSKLKLPESRKRSPAAKGRRTRDPGSPWSETAAEAPRMSAGWVERPGPSGWSASAPALSAKASMAAASSPALPRSWGLSESMRRMRASKAGSSGFNWLGGTSASCVSRASSPTIVHGTPPSPHPSPSGLSVRQPFSTGWLTRREGQSKGAFTVYS